MQLDLKCFIAVWKGRKNGVVSRHLCAIEEVFVKSLFAEKRCCCCWWRINNAKCFCAAAKKSISLPYL